MITDNQLYREIYKHNSNAKEKEANILRSCWWWW